MQRNSPGLTPRFRFSMMVLPPSSSVTSANAICGGKADTAISWRRAATTMALASLRVDEIDRRAKMCREHRLRAGNVAGENAVGEQLMFADEFLAAVDRPHHHAAI